MSDIRHRPRRHPIQAIQEGGKWGFAGRLVRAIRGLEIRCRAAPRV